MDYTNYGTNKYRAVSEEILGHSRIEGRSGFKILEKIILFCTILIFNYVFINR